MQKTITIINYNIQCKCWGLVQKGSIKMYVFVTVTLHMSISKRRIQWTFVIANMTSNKFFATWKNFLSPIILGHDNSYKMPWYIEYRFLRIPRYIDQKNKKNTGPFIKFSYWTLFPSPHLNVVYFGRSSRSNLSNIKFQRSNLNSLCSVNLKSEILNIWCNFVYSTVIVWQL